MENLTTHYLGLELKNPVIIGSSGLTNSVDKIKELEKNGAGAVVLKSLFEEQIIAEIKDSINADLTNYTESYDLISRYVREHSLDEYLKLISEAKKQSTACPVTNGQHLPNGLKVRVPMPSNSILPFFLRMKHSAVMKQIKCILK
jgi:dihydroorotate dehydrogenase